MITFSQPELSSPFAGKEWDVMGITYEGWEGKEGMGACFLWKLLKKKNEIAKMCISLVWERISAVEKCAKWVHREILFGRITNVIGTLWKQQFPFTKYTE